jgi:hypothetical protein
MDMPPMLAYTITSTLNSAALPQISIGQGPGSTLLTPANPVNNSYWFCILNAQSPTTKVAELVVPGSNNSAVPAGLDQYMSKPAYIIALVTQNLNVASVPQGAFYTYLTTHGAGRELQRLEQLNTTLGCGQITGVSYVLTTQGGSTFGYEQGSETQRVRYLMSLMQGPGPNGQTYSLCDAYTFLT